MLTPLFDDLFEILLKKKCHIRIDDYTYFDKNNIRKYDKRKMAGTELEQILITEYGERFNYGTVNTAHWIVILKVFSKDDNVFFQNICKIDKIRERARNTVAHEIFAINDSWIKKETGCSSAEIIKGLEAYGVKANRKTIYDDIELLRSIDIDIIGVQEGQSYYYYMGNRKFELAELKLLVDSIQSAKFMTEKKSSELICKIEFLTSVHNAKQLERQVYVAGRIKTDNESIYYNVDKIHTRCSGRMKNILRF